MKRAPSDSRLRRFFRSPGAAAGFVLLLVILLICLLAPALSRFDYAQIDLTSALQGPSRTHPLGTDHFGRDLLVRLACGGRLTLTITFTAGLIAAALGSAIGILSGFFGGRADGFIMRIADGLASVPALLLAITAEYLFGWGTGSFRYGLAVAGIPAFAKLMRAAVLDIMDREYIEASRALGAGPFSIIARHVLRNAAPSFFIQLVSCLADTLICCTVLGYLGIGVQPPTPEWGLMFDVAKTYIRTYPFEALFPAAAIVLTALSLHLIGNGLRDAFAGEEALS